MTRLQLNTLALSNFSGINSRQLSAKLPKHKFKQLNLGLSELDRLKWVIYRDYFVSDFKNRIIYLKQKGQCDVVFVDYIQRMKTTDFRSDRTRQVEQIATGLADISKELDVPIVVFTQLRGEAEKLPDDQVPDMSYMKESQGIAESGDVLIIAHNYDRKKDAAQLYSPDGSYIFPRFAFRIQQRYDISNQIVNINADLQCCRFVDGDSEKPDYEF